ncbi:HAMP domain-containing histidine kinase [Clostridium estertheticum]|uniref:sensor histidine kinase n=1 Tax=Clostridium estertheticum TaxID=238834 RepID=UPI0013E95D00|nr:ATP-binding protein [Clostridium estertheticum]MBN4049336.1 two-component sensor histidine kinase [bacterium AH-315-N14]MBZ9689242.1 HAMP domain-containing histidine kinase [Clostridium estertheticum]
MQSIRKRLSIILVCTAILALFISTLLVNITISTTFNKYLVEIQNKRNTRIVTYLEDVYKKNGKWSETSGIEISHEAYMSSYCLTLKDENNKVLWGMNPNEIINNMDATMQVKNGGVYTTSTFDIKSGGKIVGYIEVGQYAPVLLSKEDVDFKGSINKSIILSVVLSILITILISLFISKQFSTPLRQVSKISVHLSNGNYDERSEDKSNILELEDLRNSINTLGEKLQHQDLLRKRLISDISHEIRTPLNILQNNFEAMIDGIFPVDNERLAYLNEEVIRFGKLIDNLNGLKEIEGEEISLDVEKISLKDILSSVVKEFELVSENKKLQMTLECNTSKQFNILGETDKIKQVIINILSNAVKFTKENGEINITLKEADEKVILKIEDTGIGISKEDLPYIFERLYRGDKSRHETVGTGIGLTIVKNILTLHKANIEVKSEEGKGSAVTVYFNRV